MQITDADALQWKPLTTIREGGKEMKQLLAGTDGSPDNYRLVMIREDGVAATTPRHKHNFDQVRIVLSGRANYGPGRNIEAGELAYFPEGTPYGPEASDGNRLGLTLQSGGASGLGFLSTTQVKDASAELAKTGEFRDGVYYSSLPDARRSQDAYEAVWEYVNQRKIVYPKPRYDDPIKMKPDGFAWEAQPGQPGVEAKLLGSFSERHFELALLRVNAGSNATLGPRTGTQLVYVVSGSGTVDGKPVKAATALDVVTGSLAQVSATETLELIVIGLPIFVRAQQPATV